jgi:hypothetical protein
MTKKMAVFGIVDNAFLRLEIQGEIESDFMKAVKHIQMTMNVTFFYFDEDA